MGDKDSAIGRVSPTSAEYLLKCPARAVRHGKRVRYVETTATALGSSAHAVAKRVYLGEFDDIDEAQLRPTLAAALDDEIQRRRTKMQTAAGNRLVPEPRRWRNYSAVAGRLPKFLASEVTRRQTGVAPEQLSVEEELVSADNVIFGVPDRIERYGSLVSVIDLKSGVTHPDRVPETHRRQLMIYCYLWKERCGSWPDQAAVQRVNGRMDVIDVHPDETLELINRIRHRRDEANRNYSDEHDVAQLATPSNEACAQCNRRPFCQPFWSALDPSFTLGGANINGEATRVVARETGASIEIAVSRSNLESTPARIVVAGLSHADLPQEGARVAILDARATSQPDLALLNAWSSMVVI